MKRSQELEIEINKLRRQTGLMRHRTLPLSKWPNGDTLCPLLPKSVPLRWRLRLKTGSC